MVTSHANKESGCNFGQSQVHNSQLEIAKRHGPAWSGMVRLGAEAILGQGSGGRLKGEVEGWTWDIAVNSSVLQPSGRSRARRQER